MSTVLHKAGTRGHANHGWLDSYHTFSFSSYHNPERVHFGALRVLNDDTVAPGMGFGQHPHDNMEIISIPLKGELKHRDTTGREAVIKTGDVQIMSAGSGLQHSEVNNSNKEEVKFLQIWVFPKKRNIEPRYDQKTFDTAERKNQWQVVVSPEEKDNAIWINQDAYFSLGNLEKGKELTYDIRKDGNGVYVFVIGGNVTIEGTELNSRDGLGITDAKKIKIKADSDAEVLLIDVPLTMN
ncbi:MAG: pirin family protein [Chitinophagaceae bacterium]|nr:pirin family protein [Chitinophagaceae bacterium]